MENKEKDLRMVCWVPYNISEIQKGIQCQHGTVEYSVRAIKDNVYQQMHVKENESDMYLLYLEWAYYYKTTMVYDGGTTNTKKVDNKSHSEYVGTLNCIPYKLGKFNLDNVCFIEPDLNHAVTAVCCIIDYSQLDFETELEELDETSLSYFIRSQKFA